jgi:hypothetical protein
MPLANLHMADIIICKLGKCIKDNLLGEMWVKLKQIVWNFVQQLNTQHIFHPLTKNAITASKSRAQAVFNLLEKTHTYPWFTNFEFENFSIIPHYKYPKKLYIYI